MDTAELDLICDTNHLALRIEDIASDVGMIYWACSGLREAGLGQNESKGIEPLALRVQQDLDELLKEVRACGSGIGISWRPFSFVAFMPDGPTRPLRCGSEVNFLKNQ